MQRWIDDTVEQISNMLYTCSLTVTRDYSDALSESSVAFLLRVTEQTVNQETRAALGDGDHERNHEGRVAVLAVTSTARGDACVVLLQRIRWPLRHHRRSSSARSSERSTSTPCSRPTATLSDDRG